MKLVGRVLVSEKDLNKFVAKALWNPVRIKELRKHTLPEEAKLGD